MPDHVILKMVAQAERERKPKERVAKPEPEAQPFIQMKAKEEPLAPEHI